jgi:hypothetical protein
MTVLLRLLSLVSVGSVLCAHPILSQERLQTDWGEFRFSRSSGATSGVVAGRPDSVLQGVGTILAD